MSGTVRMQAPPGGGGTITGLSQPIITDALGQAVVPAPDVGPLVLNGWLIVSPEASDELGAPQPITVGASPFTFTNEEASAFDVVVSGGNVSAIALGRGSVSVTMGITEGPFTLSPGDSLKVTYSALPLMTMVPR